MTIHFDRRRRAFWAYHLLGWVLMSGAGCAGSEPGRASDPPVSVAGTWIGRYSGLPESARVQQEKSSSLPITLVLRQKETSLTGTATLGVGPVGLVGSVSGHKVTVSLSFGLVIDLVADGDTMRGGWEMAEPSKPGSTFFIETVLTRQK